MIFLREDKQEYADATVLILHSMFKFPFFLLLVMWNLRCELLLASEVGCAGKTSRTNRSMAKLEHRPRSLNKKALTFIPQGFWIITENKLCGKLKVYDIYIFLFFKWKNLHKLAPI